MRRWPIVEGFPASRAVVFPQVRQGLAVEQPGRTFATGRRVGRILRTVNDRARHITDHRLDAIRIRCAEQQREFATARLSAYGNEAERRLQLVCDPVERAAKVFERRIGDVVGQPWCLEVTKREGRVSARCVKRATRFIDAATRAIEYEDDGMRSG